MIKQKRDQLELFIKEQLLGPGATGFRFVDIRDELLLTKTLHNRSPLEYDNEILNIVPGGIYSTGILFPIDESDKSDGLTPINEKEVVDRDEDMSFGGAENNEESIDEDDNTKIDQMYPNTMGLTCCFNKEVIDNHTGISINIQARYYTKINNKESSYNDNYGILCESDPLGFAEFLKELDIQSYFKMSQIGENHIIPLKSISQEEMQSLKATLRSFSERKAEATSADLNSFNLKKFRSNSISSLKQSCYYEMKNNCIDSKQKAKLYSISQQLEETENRLNQINDLIDMNDSRSYGLWKSNLINIDVPFPESLPRNLIGKKSYLAKDNPRLNAFEFKLDNEEKASLSINLQLSRDSRRDNNKIYLKVQLANTSSPFTKSKEDTRYYSPFNEKVNQRTFFGVKLRIVNDCLVPYNDIRINGDKDVFNEDDTTRFIYRQFKDYAIGHGCSVKWGSTQFGSTYVETEYIPCCDTPDVDPIPRNKMEVVSNNGNFEPSLFIGNSKALSFKWLSIFSQTSDDEIISGLEGFIGAYANWIEIKKERYKYSDVTTKTLVDQELRKCETDKFRMASNINNFLKGNANKTNLEAFRIMNGVMFMQLWHSVEAKKNKVKEIINDQDFKYFGKTFYEQTNDQLFKEGEAAAWRAFQLAFIILNLDGIFKKDNDHNWERRNEWVDLVWFPTGGGKTEAYLGIIALTIINRRRIHKEQGGGTAALMRYTLRLLTLQQFQRATLMIMGMELIRRWDIYDLGEEPIFIGLWVGDNSLPNNMLPSNPDDKNNLQTEFGKLYAGQKSKVPFDRCPWCASELKPSTQPIIEEVDVFHYNRLHLRCSNEKCSFSYLRPARARKDQGPIPVSLCDDEIYQHPPALLFGTVDKFAQLAHKVSNAKNNRNKDSRRLFGRGNWESGKPKDGYLPPDLIIQDELHLLLGPLGSSVALFESAVDQLCQRKDGTRPKVISSTATTRNTELQIMALFDRKVDLFPKSGVECDDSFFAFYKRKHQDAKGSDTEYLAKRRYLGILPTGRTQIWMQMRLASILLTHRAIFELNNLKGRNPLESTAYDAQFIKAMDYYHTVVSYFNSLKEVGKTESQIHTYIIKEIRRVFNRAVRPGKLMHALYSYSISKGELTGRLSGDEVKNELSRISASWDPNKRFAYKIDSEIINGHTPPDFVVATNMISVGIDVSRFNSIIMNSMPRNIAEYIQASSRVARESYGLVLTVHHPFRARDMSHYEKFIEFHEKMYSYVEPISITPFTKKAIERYLGLYVATMLRHTTDFTNRESASSISNMNESELKKLINQLSSYFENRRVHMNNTKVSDLVKNLLREDNVDTIKQWINASINDWRELSNATLSEKKTLVFNNKSSKATPSQEQLYVEIEEYEGNIHSRKWQVPMSLRVIEPEAALKIKSI
jgi:hypothetical protein